MICKKQVDGFNWVLDIADNGIGRTLYRSNSLGKDFSFSRECGFMYILNKTVKTGMTCIDLGANIGYATMFMLRNVGDSGFVYAIEPDPHNLQYLKANIKENGFLDSSKVEVAQCLISDYKGMSSYWIADQPNLNSIDKTKHSIKEATAPCYTIEDFCNNRRYPNFIKMDIEGHEVSVLRGAYDYFKNNDNETHVLMEIHPSLYNKQNNFAEILMKYFNIGFQCSYIISTPVASPELFVKLGHTPVYTIHSDGFERGLYTNINNHDAIQITCQENLQPWQNAYTKKIARAMMISRI